jgi:hypothetical protein
MGFDVFAMQYQVPTPTHFDYANMNSTIGGSRNLVVDGCGLITGNTLPTIHFKNSQGLYMSTCITFRLDPSRLLPSKQPSLQAQQVTLIYSNYE